VIRESIFADGVMVLCSSLTQRLWKLWVIR